MGPGREKKDQEGRGISARAACVGGPSAGVIIGRALGSRGAGGGENQVSFPGGPGGAGTQPQGWGWGDPNRRLAQGEIEGRSHRPWSAGAWGGEARRGLRESLVLGAPEMRRTQHSGARRLRGQLDPSQTAFPTGYGRSVSLFKSLNWKAPFQRRA